MKITKLETFHVKPRWLFLKVHTDKDVVGWGEPIVEGKAQTVEACVHEMGRLIMGQDPRRIEHLWQIMYRGSFYRGGPVLMSAISGIEQALWDILGKHLNAPVYQLLGGHVRDRIRIYRHMKYESKNVGGGDELRRVLKEPGFDAYKMSPHGATPMIETFERVEAAAMQVGAAREAMGKAVDIAIDAHGRLTPANSIRFAKMIEPYFPMFLEEPVLPGDTLALKRISEATSIPIATGERLFGRWQFQEIIEQEVVAVVQPDLSHCGGIMEGRKIAAMAESRNIALAPHCPLGPICLAASLQLAACTPNFLIQEHVTLGEEYLKTPFKCDNGHVPLPTGPGLGIEIDEEKVRVGQYDGSWDTPQFRLPDGSVTEW